MKGLSFRFYRKHTENVSSVALLIDYKNEIILYRHMQIHAEHNDTMIMTTRQ